MSGCKRTQRSGGDMGATVSSTTSEESISTTAVISVKSVSDLRLAATPAQEMNLKNIINQVFHQVSKYEKQAALKNVIKENDGKRVLVFVEKKRQADFLAVLLSEQQLPTSSIHGARVRRDRLRALKSFESGHRRILVATKVDLDIKSVDIVVNYDLPKSIDEYVHRIGCAGCVGNRGQAVSFFDADQDADLVVGLAEVHRQADQPIPDFLQGGGSDTATYQGNKYGGSDADARDLNDASAAAFGGQQPAEDWQLVDW